MIFICEWVKYCIQSSLIEVVSQVQNEANLLPIVPKIPQLQNLVDCGHITNEAILLLFEPFGSALSNMKKMGKDEVDLLVQDIGVALITLHVRPNNVESCEAQNKNWDRSYIMPDVTQELIWIWQGFVDTRDSNEKYCYWFSL